MRTEIFVAVLVLAFVLSPAGVVAKPSAPPIAIPSPSASVDSIQFITQPSAALALQQMDAGTMDIYLNGLKTQSTIQAALTDTNLDVLRGTGQIFNLFVNPVPVNQTLAPGIFNPFESAEARRALNLLIDRDAMNRDVFGGLGLPHSTMWNPESPEYTRDPFFFHDQDRSYSYNFTRGQAMLFDALNASGAVYSGGQWTWQGNPVVVQFIVRVEDLRNQVGDYIAFVLRSLGLQVNEQKVTGSVAFNTVYYGPPDMGNWTLYTESFGQYDLLPWSDVDLYYFSCGGQGETIWSFYSPAPALAQICLELLTGSYTSIAQREALVEQGSALAMNESVRVWLLDSDVYAYAKRVQGLVPGFVAPPLGLFSLRSAHFSTPGGTLVAGQVAQLLGPYQPWQDLAFIYDRNVAYTFTDPGLGVHPYTGEYIPVRSDFQVTTAGPTGSLSVPSDATIYNATSEAWEAVPANTVATSVVTFNYTFGDWHHGVPMDMNDVLYAVSLIARRYNGDIAAHDASALSYHDWVFATLFRGLRVLDATRLEIYIDSWHPDPSFIAEAADVWPTTPWEVGELAMDTTLHDHTRVSEFTAAYDGLVPIDLATGATIGYMDREISDGNVTTSGAGVTVPPGFAGFISQAEATARWTNLIAWRNAYANYYPSNGPFMLTNVDPIMGEITVTRFQDYPIPSDRWDSFQTPQIPTLSVDPVPDVKPGATAVINMTTLVAGLPYSNATVRYRILPSNLSEVLAAGNASLVAPGIWQAVLDSSFTSAVPFGTYEIQAVAVGFDASLPVFANQSFFIGTDTTPPASAIASIAPYWHATAPVSLQVTAADDRTGVASVALYVAFSADNVSWSAPAEAMNETAPPFTFAYTPSQGGGHYRFWTLATDGAGNFETLSGKPATGEAAIGFDPTAPSSVLTGPAGYWARTTPVSLTATAADTLSGVASVQLMVSFSADNASWSTPAAAGTDTSSPYSFSFTAGQGAGHYRLWSVATDGAGNTESLGSKPATGEVKLGYDTMAPSSVLTGPTGYWAPTTPISLTATAADALDGVGSVQLMVSFSADNVSWSSPTLAASDTSSPYSFSFTPTQGDGHYRFWSVATDGAGNTESLASKPATGEVKLGYDTTSPSSSLVSPAAYWQRSAPLTLTATATDAMSGIVSVQLLVSFSADNATWSAPSVLATDTTSPYVFSFTPTQGDGHYRFWVLATDAAGNAQALSSKPTTGEVVVGLDRVAPTVVSSSPANAATNVAVSGTTIRVTFSEAVDQAEAQAAFSISPSVQGAFSWSGNALTFTPSSALANGTTYTVTLATTVTDVAGNPLAAAYTFSFTTVAPSTPPPQTLDWLLPVGIAAVVIVVAAVLVWWWVARRSKP